MGKELHSKFSSEHLKTASDVIRALAHPKRLTILEFIARNSPACVNDIYTNLRLEQSVTSQHLRVLRMAGLVETKREGKFVYYHLNSEHLQKAVEAGKLLAGLVRDNKIKAD